MLLISIFSPQNLAHFLLQHCFKSGPSYEVFDYPEGEGNGVSND